MKKIIALVLLCGVLMTAFMTACTDNGGNTDTTTQPDTTDAATKSEPLPEDVLQNNRAVLARIGFEEVMNYINLSEAYGVHIEIGEEDTVAQIIERIKADGGDFETRNIRTDIKFFDYAMKNPHSEDGQGMYSLRSEANFVEIYTD